MRRYNIVSRILLILSVIDFALAAPVLVQEKRQAYVDVVHTPGDAITMWGKRGGSEMVWEESIKSVEAWGKPKESPAAPPSSSSAPSGPGHGSTNVLEAPPPGGSAASDWRGDHELMEVSTPSADPWSFTTTDHESPGLLYAPASSQHGSVNDLVVTDAPQLNPASRKRPWTELGSEEDPPRAHEYQAWYPPSQGAGSSTGFFSSDHESQMTHSPWPVAGSQTAPEHGLPYGPRPNLEASTGPVRQSMREDYQLNNLQLEYAAYYALKGLKGKANNPGQG